jgi:ankyrin repeat protein
VEPSATTPDSPAKSTEVATTNSPAANSAETSGPERLPVDQQAMNEAALNGNLEKITGFITQGADPNGIDQDGRTPLMFAAFNGHTEIVRLLLEAGAEPGLRDAMGRTALLYASTGPFAETVKLLLDHHSDPNMVDHDEHFSPLMHAAAEGQLEVVRILLDAGADPFLKDIDGETAALFARNNGHTEVAGLIQSVIDSKQ